MLYACSYCDIFNSRPRKSASSKAILHLAPDNPVNYLL